MEFQRASRSLVGCALAVAIAVPASAETLPRGAAPMATPPTALHMGGTGAATEPFRRIGARFTADTGITVEIIPGLGSAGGISATAEGVLQLSVSGRPLSASEATRGLASVLTICTPYVLASSHPSPGSVDSATVAAVYAQAAPRWPDGTPLRIVLRPKAESDNATMAALFPGMEQAMAQARTRDAIPIGATDQDNAELAEHIPGSLIGATYAQILTEHRGLRFVAINGELPGTDALESGRYPFAKHLYVISATHPAPEASRFLDFLATAEGGEALREAGIVPCPK